VREEKSALRMSGDASGLGRARKNRMISCRTVIRACGRSPPGPVPVGADSEVEARVRVEIAR
jgi:hypothetical protein